MGANEDQFPASERPTANMGHGATLAIVDGRWIGKVASLTDETIVLKDAFEIVAPALPIQGPGGVSFMRQTLIFPMAATTGPKKLMIRFSVFMWIEELDSHERKAIETQYADQLALCERTRVQRETGLVLKG